MKNLALLLLTISTTAWSGETNERTKSMNPDIGLNILGIAQRRTTGPDSPLSSDRNGLSLQEVELQLKSDVDPHFRAAGLLSIHQEDAGAGYAIEPEEVYFETRNLPSLTIRGGKYLLAAGKHNTLHTHAFAFIDEPLANQTIFGGEGLNEVAISVSHLLPTSWFSEFTVQGYSPTSEALYTTMPDATGATTSTPTGKIAGLAHLKNLFDLNSDTTLEIGATGGQGKNGYDLNTTIYGGDLTVKWRPSEGGKYTALIWSNEYLQAKKSGFVDATTLLDYSKLGGATTWVQYQFAQQWWVQGRYDRLGMPHSDGFSKKNRYTGLIAFIPSEFSSFRLQYDHTNTVGESTPERRVALQFNMSIGAHPAHAY